MDYSNLINELCKHINSGDRDYTSLWLEFLRNAIDEKTANLEHQVLLKSLKEKLDNLPPPSIPPLPYGSSTISISSGLIPRSSAARSYKMGG